MTDTVGGSEPDPDFDAQFAQLVREMEQGRPAAVHEPSARARMLQNRWREQPPPTTPWRGEVPTVGDATVKRGARAVGLGSTSTPDPGRRSWFRPPRLGRGARIGGGRAGGARIGGVGRDWPRDVVIAVIVCALVVAAVVTIRQDHARAASAGAPAAVTQSPASAGAAHPAANAMIPVARLFPRTIPAADGGVYTLVQSGDLADCVKSDMVGTTLAGLFARSDGCVGGEGALYEDSAKDQFNVTVFTLDNPADAVKIATDLAMDPTDFEVATLVPPTGSGLAELPATAGITQQFESDGNRLGVFMAQWSDGRSADYPALQKLLGPLQQAIGKTLAADAG